MSAAGRSGASSQINEGASKVVIPLYEERLQVGTRQVEAGGVRIRKEVTTDTVNQPVQVRRETLVIDRLSADSTTPSSQSAFGANTSAGAPFEQKDIEIRLMREEPVVEKQTVQTGQIVVEKRSQTEQATVQREVRRENIDVNRFGNAAENVIISENLRQQQRASGGTGSASESATGTARSSGEITSLQALSATAGTSVIGKQVRLSDVKVQQVIGENSMVLQSGGNQVIVRTSQPATGIKQGDTVQVTGRIQKAPENFADLGINQEQIQQVQNRQVYIEAQSVRPAAQ